jgi:hypothetical protein
MTQTTPSAKECEFNVLMKLYEVVYPMADKDQQKEMHEKLSVMNVARRAEREKAENEYYDV